MTIFLCFLNMHSLSAKEIFQDQKTGQEFLFLGGLKENQKKWLNLNNGKVEWIENDKLQQQSGQLTAEIFYDKINKKNLVFYAEGTEPFWSATISGNKLKVTMPGRGSDELAITINIDKHPLDSAFLLMFQSKDYQSYGVIRKLWWDTPCDISINDEVSTFEIFMNYKGRVNKGCARLDK